MDNKKVIPIIPMEYSIFCYSCGWRPPALTCEICKTSNCIFCIQGEKTYCRHCVRHNKEEVAKIDLRNKKPRSAPCCTIS